jgi:hypothetical protein
MHFCSFFQLFEPNNFLKDTQGKMFYFKLFALKLIIETFY